MKNTNPRNRLMEIIAAGVGIVIAAVLLAAVAIKILRHFNLIQ